MITNVISLKNYLHCDNVVLKSIIKKFIEEAGSITRNIKKACAEANWPSVRQDAHKMLSSVKIFEFSDLAALLEKIETDAERKTNIADIRQNVEKLESEMDHLLPEMAITMEELA